MSVNWRVLTAAQLAARGHSIGDIRGLVRRGELIRARRGVYLVGPRLEGIDGWFQDVALAAAGGPDALITGQAAAALYGLDGFDPGAAIAVQVARSTTASFPGTRRLRLMDAPEQVHGVWCTSPGETLLGLGADLSPRPGCAAAARPLPPVDLVELALEAALRRNLVTVSGLADLAAAADGKRPGRDVLLEALARRPDQPPTESYLETRVVQVLRDAGLPLFDRQVELADDDGFIGRVDFSRAGVVIEALGKAWHLPTFDPDTLRSSRLSAAGHRVLSFTFHHVEAMPSRVARAVARALARAGG